MEAQWDGILCHISRSASMRSSEIRRLSSQFRNASVDSAGPHDVCGAICGENAVLCAGSRHLADEDVMRCLDLPFHLLDAIWNATDNWLELTAPETRRQLIADWEEAQGGCGDGGVDLSGGRCR